MAGCGREGRAWARRRPSARPRGHASESEKEVTDHLSFKKKTRSRMAPPPLTLRLINLATLLAEEHPATRAPPPGALAGGGGGGGWTEAQLRAHYRGGGQAGGAAGGLLPPPGPGAPPPGTVAAAAGGSAASYRAAAAAWGIPPRPAGLFPAADPLLSTLAATPDAWPFEKLLPGDVILHAAPAVSWASGNAAAAAGVDLRLFGVPHPTPGSPFPHGAVRGAVRFGEGASIGAGHWLPVHGGAVSTSKGTGSHCLGRRVCTLFFSLSLH